MREGSTSKPVRGAVVSVLGALRLLALLSLHQTSCYSLKNPTTDVISTRAAVGMGTSLATNEAVLYIFCMSDSVY